MSLQFVPNLYIFVPNFQNSYMKTRKRTLFFALLLLAGVYPILTGCEHDYYQPERMEGKGTSLFGDNIAVPSSFDWSTLRSVNLDIEVDDRFDGNYYYLVELYDAHPFFYENASLLGKGVAKKGINFTFSPTLPNGLETIFIKQTDPAGMEKVTAVSVDDATQLSVSFLHGSSSLRSATASASSFRAAPADLQTSYPTPADAIVINEQSPANYTLVTNKAYVIRGTYTGAIQFPNEGNVALYVEGTWNNSSSGFVLQDGAKLIVQDGGCFAASGTVEITGNNNSTLVIAPSGSFIGEKTTIRFTGAGKVINNGILDASLIHFPSLGMMYNAGNASVGEFQVNSPENRIVNDNRLIIAKANFTNGEVVNNNLLEIADLHVNGTTIRNSKKVTVTNGEFMNGIFDNHCLAEFGKVTTSGTVFIGAEETLLSVDEYTLASGTRFDLDSHAIFEVTGSISFNSTKSYINGIGSKTALARLEKIIFNGWNNLDIEGNLELENSNFSNLSSGTAFSLKAPALWVQKGESSVTIEATECNNGGNPVGGSGQPPVNPSFPIIWNGIDVTYMFEDNWPLLGDYDMNDVVLNVKPSYTIEQGNRVSQLDLAVTLQAVGGIKKLALGMQLDGVAPASVKGVGVTTNPGRTNTVFGSILANGLESGQSLAVIPIFDDVHMAFGVDAGTMVNTTAGDQSVTREPLKVTVTIQFNTPVNFEDVAIDRLNPFIVNGGYSSRRYEVHMAGFVPTDKANREILGKVGDDNSSVEERRYYVSDKNMIWGLAVPGSCPYPKEFTSIRKAYPDLEKWAVSAGEEAKDWYTRPDLNFVYHSK